MDPSLYDQIRDLFDRVNDDTGERAVFEPKALTEECYTMSQALTALYLKKQKNFRAISSVTGLKAFPVMWMASIWGMQTYFKTPRPGSMYLSPSQYDTKEKVRAASNKARDSLVRENPIEPEAEIVMDLFTEKMLLSLKDVGLNVSPEKYREMLEAHLTWGYEFGRQICGH